MATKKLNLVQALQHWQVFSYDHRSGEKKLKLEGATGKLWRGDTPTRFFLKNYVIGEEDVDGDTETDHWREMIDGSITLINGSWIIIEGWVDQDGAKEPGKKPSEVYSQKFEREVWHFMCLEEEK
jgi:hypothetical protein